MLYREIIAVCSQIHTKHINTLCGQNVQFLNFTSGCTYSDHFDLKGYVNKNVQLRDTSTTNRHSEAGSAAGFKMCTLTDWK